MSSNIQSFIQKLKEQNDEDTVYSKPTEDSIKVIPPEKTVKKEIRFKINKDKEKEEQLFKLSETPESKKEKWLEYYHRALVSKKKNSVVERMKQGKFMITESEEVIIQPDYDTKDKTTRQILKERWF